MKNDPDDTAGVAAEPLSMVDAIPRDESVTTYRIKLHRAVEILYSPLVLSAVSDFEEDLHRVVRMFSLILIAVV